MKVVFGLVALVLCAFSISGHPIDQDQNLEEILKSILKELSDYENNDEVDDTTTIDNDDQDDDSSEVVTPKAKEYKWVPKGESSKVPDNAVVAGKDSDGTIVYVVRVWNEEENRFVVGKYATRGYAYIYKDGKELGVSHFTFLTASYPSWDSKSNSDNKVYTDEHYDAVFVCRARHEVVQIFEFNDAMGEDQVEHQKKFITIPGYVDEDDNKCKYSYGYKGYETDKYEVLYV